jgi:hypothetical protein
MIKDDESTVASITAYLEEIMLKVKPHPDYPAEAVKKAKAFIARLKAKSDIK